MKMEEIKKGLGENDRGDRGRGEELIERST